MEILEQSEGIEYAPSEELAQDSQQDEELVKKLSQKIMEQAARLTQLESYKVICEQRIKQLEPSHPLPVTKQHLAENKSELEDLRIQLQEKEQELMQFMQKNDMLESQQQQSYSQA